ncbi:MAG: glycine--tRNA ligase subunit beta [Nitrospirae bacterium]|nr:glycine--tRNA ligase subunit beta [Nitrospirota bacterium]
MKPFLLEIGVEELPARFIPKGVQALKNGLITLLDEASVDYDEIREYATPRRLAILINDISERQKDRSKEVLGPPKKIAIDENGNFTRAAMGFAKSQNVDTGSLKIISTERGEYLASNIEEKGRMTKEVLSDLLPKLITSLQFPKSMRWGNGSLRFARPIHWITALLGQDVIDFELDGLRSGNTTRGHRFFSPEPILIIDPLTYREALSNNFVMTDPEERKIAILNGIKKIEGAHNFKVREDNDLVDTVTFLVEYPTVVLGNFDPRYLTLPSELLITVMKSHQKYFSVEDGQGNLLPYFVLISNTKSENDDIVRRGAERVLRARLEDASFYYSEDTGRSLGDFVDQLKEVTFQEKLGSLYQKAERISALCAFLCDKLGISNKERVLRAAMLSKADLVTGVIREFPELQGYMGMIYANNSGEGGEVALAINEHYKPKFSGDTVPSGETGAIVSIADKMDNIASFFTLGLIPTGSEDPFALRRQAAGIMNILQKRDYALALNALIGKALEQIEKDSSLRDQLIQKIIRFFEQRLEGLLLEEGYRYDIVNAVLSLENRDMRDFRNRLEILSSLTQEAGFPDLLTVAKRVYNILAKIEMGGIKQDILNEPAEKELFQAAIKTEKRLTETNFRSLLELTGPINVFFNNVLVMDKNPEIRSNRLALLSYVKKIFDSLGDFSKIVS